MKICYLADGKSIHTQRWCKHFAALGHEVHLITFRDVDLDGCTVHFVHSGNINVQGGNYGILRNIRKTRRLIREINPDILHALYATSYGFVGARSGFHPYVVTALGTDVLISPQQSWLYRKMVQYVFKRADWLTAMADHMRETMICLGADTGKTETVVFGIDTRVFNANGRNVPDDKFVILSTRNFEPVYNIPLLIDAVKLIGNAIPNLELQLIGQGSKMHEIEDYVNKSGLGNQTIFYGRVAQAEIADRMRQAHIFVSTSLSDGNNVSLNEAMACGAVSVVTDIPANRQWIKSGVNGYLVPVDNPQVLADHIIKVYQNYADIQRTAMEFNPPCIAASADWNKNMQKVEQKYFSLHTTWKNKN